MIPIQEDFEVYRERPGFTSWKVPAFCNNDWIALTLLDMCEEIGVEQPFHVAYGTPQCLWAGGRPSAIRQKMTEAELERYFEAYDRHGVKVALTLSRLSLNTSDLKDPYCNMILDVAERHGAEAIVVENKLARHIRKTHPGIRLIGSLDKPIIDLSPGYDDETGYYLRNLELYDEVVVRCEYAIDPELIGQLPEDCRDRVEVIVNQICIPNCPDCRKHIGAIEEWNHEGCHGQCQVCFHADVASDLKRRLKANVFISTRRINQLVEMGVYKMKIGGRNAPIPKFLDLLSTYVFEPSGAFIPMRVAMSNDYRTAMQRNPRLAPWSLPE
ncbi:hypothetical protein [Slackia heliotrinireducens]|uniref:hypothetical protein n=1 Tax=Slackia heliotrinireducens TaxID=84110 RepID=UPI00331620B4